MTQLTKSQLRHLTALARHLRIILPLIPRLPPEASSRQQNALRLLKRQNLPRIEKFLAEWNNSSSDA